MKKKLLILGTLMLSAVGLAACGSTTEPTKENNNALQIMTTFYPMYEFTKEIVGDVGDVELLIPAGTEPHDFEPSAKDIAKLTEADAFIYNSKELETWVPDITGDFENDKTAIIEAASDIDLVEGADEEEEGHEGHSHSHALDPHVWLDPVLAMQEVKTITTKLSKAYPKYADTFAKNSAAYLEKLSALDEKFQVLQTATQKTFVTQHAAFGYLARQYGLTQEAVSGLTPDEEPTASRLAELKDYVKKNKIEVIYFEESASSKVAETLASEANVKLAVLNPLEGLSKEKIAAGESYITVMEDNLKHLQLTIK